MEPYLKTIICATCLSNDRELFQDKHLGQIMLLFPKYLRLNLNEDRVCWECRAVLMKLWKFHQQAVRAQQLMNNILLNQEGELTNLSSLDQRDKIVVVDIPSNLVTVTSGPVLTNTNNRTMNSAIDNGKVYFMENEDLTNTSRTRQVASSTNNSKVVPVVVRNDKDYIQSNIVPSEGAKNASESQHDRITNPNVNKVVLYSVPMEVKTINDNNNDDIEKLNVNVNKVMLDHMPLEVNNDDCNDDVENSITRKTYIVRKNKNKNDMNYKDLIKFVNILKENKIRYRDVDVFDEIPIVDMRHIEIKGLNENNDDETESNDKSEGNDDTNSLEGENEPNTTKPTYKRATGKRRYNCKDIRVYTNIIEIEVSETQMQELRMKDRDSEYYLKAKFKCEKCIFGYADVGLYKAHLYKHKEEYGPELCSVCEQRFKDPAALNKHHLIHLRAFQCTVCQLWSRFVHTLLGQCRCRPTPDGLFVCKECQEPFKTAEQRRVHTAATHPPPDGRVQCLKCRKFLKSQESLKKHMLRHTPAGQMVQCEICQAKVHIRSLTAHMDKIHERGSHYCKPCDKFYKSRLSYITHLKTNSKHVSTRYECDHCKRTFASKAYVADHIAAAHLSNTKVHQCKFCDKKYQQAISLRVHMRTRHGVGVAVKDKVCYVCGKAFADSHVLRDHLMIHTGEKPHQCQYCEWKFAQRSTLRTHHKFKHKGLPLTPPVTHK